MENSDNENFVDHTTPYSCSSDIDTVISELQTKASEPFGLTTIT